MGDELPEINQTGRRLEITEADLAAARSPSPPPPAAPPPGPPAPPVAPGERPFAPQAEGGASDKDWTEATRLMCAAAYLDGTFAQEVVDEIIHEHHRAVQVPTGVDIATVAKHCLAACRQKLVRDSLLSVDVLLTIILFFDKRSLSWLLFGFLLAWAIVLWDIWTATYLKVVKRLSPLSFSAHTAPVPSDPHVSRRIDELARDQRGNLTVYSGFLPFSGAGIDVGGWSFLIDLRKGLEDAFGERTAASELTTPELYESVERAMAALEMSNLEIRDRLFVSGSDVRDDRRLMPNLLGPPLAWVDLNVLGHYMVAPTHQIRHYRCIEIVDWRGELVVSLFLRFAVSNGRLFCELNKFLLVPLKEELHRLNHLGAGIRPRDVLSMVGRACVSTPALSLRAPKVVFRPLTRSWEASGEARRVEKDLFFDYGAPETAIDRVRSTHYRRYFQRLDKERYDKVLERTVLDSIVEVLERHGVDTAEIAERRATIVNNGIMMSKGSSLNANNLAVGPRPTIHFNMPRPGGSGGKSSPGLGH